MKRQKRIEADCFNCGEKLYRLEWRVKKFSKQLCSRKCCNIYRANIISKKRKGKTYNELYGEERAKELRKKLQKLHIGLQAGKNHPLYIKINFIKLLFFHFLGKTANEIGKKLGCPAAIIRNRLKLVGLSYNKCTTASTETKLKQSEKAKLRVGEKATAWQGGKSFEEYTKDFNTKFKNLIRKRDNQICMLCGIHREKLNRALDVHHINYDKKLSIPENCVSLCLNCHMKTNVKNRKYWIKFFHSILSEKYEYKYNEVEEIVLHLKNDK